MRTIHTEIGIMAPATIVWEVLTDFANWESWNPILRVAGEAEEGARLTVILSAPGQKRVTLHAKIAKLMQGHELRWQVTKGLPLLFNAEHGFRIVPEDTGRCRFEQFESFKGFIAPAVMKRSENAIKTGFIAMNRALKREAERAARERT